MSYTPRTVVASAPVTTTGNSGAIYLGGLQNAGGSPEWLSLLVSSTAVTGTTPSMTITIDWSMDGTVFASNDPTQDAFTAMTATGAKVKRFALLAPYYRINWAITGTTPSFTFSITELAIDET